MKSIVEQRIFQWVCYANKVQCHITTISWKHRKTNIIRPSWAPGQSTDFRRKTVSMVATLASQDPNLFDTSTRPQAVHAMNGRQLPQVESLHPRRPLSNNCILESRIVDKSEWIHNKLWRTNIDGSLMWLKWKQESVTKFMTALRRDVRSSDRIHGDSRKIVMICNIWKVHQIKNLKPMWNISRI